MSDNNPPQKMGYSCTALAMNIHVLSAQVVMSTGLGTIDWPAGSADTAPVLP
jgi:hypothetical protein